MSGTPAIAEDLAQLATRLRPRLHRYVARMAGSALDGEDIVQDALAKAASRFDAHAVRQPEAWLFRIAHNTAMDFLRRRALERGLFAEWDDDDGAEAMEQVGAAGLGPAPDDALLRAETASAALGTFARLPPRQRSAVILFDVLGHALDETAVLLDTNVPAVKAALHRGRSRLRELGREAPEAAATPQLSPEQHELVQRYAQRFNARDFDGLRNLLAEDARLELPGRLTAKGKPQVSNYFSNYASVPAMRAETALIEGRPGLWIFGEGGAADATAPALYPILLDWRDGMLAGILDFRYARYVTETLAAPTAGPTAARDARIGEP